MQNPQFTTTDKTNGKAVSSLIIGIVSWLLFLILLCLNYVILPIFTVATMGFGGLLYICTLSVSCLSPLGWLIGTILGYLAKNEIKQSNDSNPGMANVGFILNAIGLGITVLSICVIAILAVTGTSLPFFTEFLRQIQ